MQGIKNRMNGTAAKSNIQNFPILVTAADTKRASHRKFWPWIEERLWHLGILKMPDEQPGLKINWSTVTCLLVVLFAIGGLYYYTWAVAGEHYYRKGTEDAEKREMMRRLDIAEKKADAADTKATYAVRGTDNSTGHATEDTKKSDGGH